MNEDEKMEIYNKGFEAGKVHRTPSPQTEAQLKLIKLFLSVILGLITILFVIVWIN